MESVSAHTTHLPLVLLHRPPDFNPRLISDLSTFYRLRLRFIRFGSVQVGTLLWNARHWTGTLLWNACSEPAPDSTTLTSTSVSGEASASPVLPARFRRIIADYSVGLLIDVLRRVSAADRFVRAGSWPVNGDFPLGSKVGGKRVGIVGLGNIGMRISKRLEAFGCTIAYNSRKVKPSFSFPYFANILELAAWSDILVVSCSYTSETHHIIDKDVMKALGKDGIIINVGRGALIDEKELVQFLLHGEIGGAGLDVVENEPHVPKELFDLDKVVLSPHLAVLTPESFVAVQKLIRDNLEAFFSNKPLKGEINLNVQTASRP